MTTRDWELSEFTVGAQASQMRRGSWRLTLFLLLIAALVAAGIVWTSLATIEEVARAEGRVVPSGRARAVESLEGGIVQSILTEEGDTVAAGQVMIEIDDTGAAAEVGELLARRLALLARAERLATEAAGHETLVFSDPEIAPEGPLALSEMALFDSRRASYVGQRVVLDAQIAQREQEIVELTSGLARVGESLSLLDEEIDLRNRSGVVPRAQILPLERERTAKRQEGDALTSRRAAAGAALDEAEARLTELDLLRRADINAERSETLNEIRVIDETLKRARDVVARTDLRAPVSGIVSVLNVNTIGSVIAPGEEVMRIVPEGDALEVEARVRPEDIAFVRPDLEASVKLTAFDFTIYGALAGRVVRVGADAERDEATGQSYFPIIVRTEEKALERAGTRHEIKPGMVASVDILTGERTVLDYLLKPFRKARKEALRER